MAFERIVWVLQVNRLSLDLWLVKVSGKVKARKVDAVANGEKGIDVFWSRVRKAVKGEGLRILMSDDISYVIRLTKPEDVELENLRGWVLAQVRKYIPEDLGDNNWDYVLGDGKLAQTNKLVVFAPVGRIWEMVCSYVNKYKLKVEAVEPVSAACIRSKDPIVGLAVKSDLELRAQDPYTLNIEIENIKPSVPKNLAEDVSRKPRALLLVFLFAFVVLGLFSWVVWIYIISPIFFPVTTKVNRGNDIELVKMTLKDEVKEELSTITPTPTSADSETKEIVYKKDSEFQVQVLNGSGKAGIAKTLADFLTEMGIENISVGNSINKYDVMRVGFGSKVSPVYREEFIDKLMQKGYTPNIDENILLTGASEVDIVIIVI